MTKNSGKTAIVTGASSGIGWATAEALAREGFTVFGTSRRPNGKAPAGVTMLPCDVTDDESVKVLISTVLARTGRIDLLVNNAGFGVIGAAEESSIEQITEIFDVNLFGVMRTTNAVLPSMRERGAGHIINIGSVLGIVPAPYSAYYSSTKHALEGYSESLDHEVRAFNVRVSVIQPAFTRTSFEQNAVEPDRKLEVYEKPRADARAMISDVLPKSDLPEVVADVVVAAAADKNPKRRYTAGKQARQISMLRRFAPAGMFDKTFRKEMRLPA